MPAPTYSASTGWPAPTARGPLSAVVRLPGSKSLTNRELVLSALAEGPSMIRRPLEARDTDLMLEALRRLGAVVDRAEDGTLRIEPRPLTGGIDIDCGLAGTVMRFLPPVALLADAPVRFDGDERARARPMATTSMSACLVTSGRSRVREWQMVTVASRCKSNSATGRPTMLLRPTTQARAPEISTPSRTSSSMMPDGVQGRSAGRRCIIRPTLTG